MAIIPAREAPQPVRPHFGAPVPRIMSHQGQKWHSARAYLPSPQGERYRCVRLRSSLSWSGLSRLVPTIQPSTCPGACRTLDPRDKPEDDPDIFCRRHTTTPCTHQLLQEAAGHRTLMAAVEGPSSRVDGAGGHAL